MGSTEGGNAKKIARRKVKEHVKRLDIGNGWATKFLFGEHAHDGDKYYFRVSKGHAYMVLCAFDGGDTFQVWALSVIR